METKRKGRPPKNAPVAASASAQPSDSMDVEEDVAVPEEPSKRRGRPRGKAPTAPSAAVTVDEPSSSDEPAPKKLKKAQAESATVAADQPTTSSQAASKGRGRAKKAAEEPEDEPPVVANGHAAPPVADRTTAASKSAPKGRGRAKKAADEPVDIAASTNGIPPVAPVDDEPVVAKAVLKGRGRAKKADDEPVASTSVPPVDDEPTVAKAKGRRGQKKIVDAPTVTPDDEEEVDPVAVKKVDDKKKGGRGRGQKKPVDVPAATLGQLLKYRFLNAKDDEEEEEDPVVAPKADAKKKGRPAKAAKLADPVPSTSNGTSDSEDADTKPPKKKGRQAKGDKASTSSAPPADADEDEEPAPTVTTTKQVTIKGRAPVDDLYSGAASVHVYYEGDDVYDAALNQTSIDNNNNKFYLVQLLEHDSRKQYVVHQRWGRVGVRGQQSQQDCGSDLAQAKKLFEAKFKDKTKNNWSEREDFEKVPGKYDMIHRDYEATDVPDAAGPSGAVVASAPAKPPPDSKLPKPVQQLMECIFDIKMMESQIMEMKYDAQKAPLGKLTTQQIKNGYLTLQKIVRILNLVPGQAVGAVNQRDLLDACNEYYTRIPHVFGMTRPPIINTSVMLKREMDLLETLGDIEVAMRAIKDTMSTTGNAIDHHYDSLKVDIQPIDHAGDMFKLIQRYLLETHGPSHSDYTLELLNAFSLAKDATFRADVGNRMLLWHGSRLSNFVGILSQGLRIAPPEAPVTGYMFGKGIYFADVSTKSANYCFSQTSDNVGMMLLCEVALGEPNELFDAKYDADKLPPGKFCTKGVGRFAPDASTYQTIEDGIKIPVGKCVDAQPKSRAAMDLALQYNEYIVYDVKQVRMRYLVQVKFNYKRGRYGY